jgi:hypothetical protein
MRVNDLDPAAPNERLAMIASGGLFSYSQTLRRV